MSSHGPHESSIVAGLADGCPRCEEHAANPLASLDSEHLNDLWRRMVAFEYEDQDKFRPRSRAEERAMRVMHEHARFVLRVRLATQAGLWAVTFP